MIPVQQEQQLRQLLQHHAPSTVPPVVASLLERKSSVGEASSGIRGKRRRRRRVVPTNSATAAAFLLFWTVAARMTVVGHAFYPHVQINVPSSSGRRRTTRCQRISSVSRSSSSSSSSEPPDEEQPSSDQLNQPSRRRPVRNNNTANHNITVTVVPASMELELLHRVSQLEQLVAKQNVELERLKQECQDLTHTVAAFARVVEILRQAGLQTTTEDNEPPQRPAPQKSSLTTATGRTKTVVESFDDSEIFGKAPSTVMDAADVAGAAILAGILAGKQRMLVDVRDADLSRDPETLVQFIELAVLPVAAGLEGLQSKRNRLKIVFSTVSQLSQFRKTMTLSVPEVVALSTLAFDPIEDDRDNLVVIVAPAPDDEEGLEAMNSLLRLDDDDTTLEIESSMLPKQQPSSRRPIKQPVVVLNHHMLPITGPAAKFEVAYHLRLLSVQYFSGIPSSGHDDVVSAPALKEEEQVDDVSPLLLQTGDSNDEDDAIALSSLANKTNTTRRKKEAELEAAVEHAHQIGTHQGMTRAMVVRAYAKPWYVFVDTSPDTDADFEVAGTFETEPTQDEVNSAIVECLAGSEEEDEIVAQQMQQALESGQLGRVSDLLGSMSLDHFEDWDDEDDDGNDDDDLWNAFNEDSV